MPGVGNCVNVFYDTEFIDTEKGTELISIGLVTDSGQEYYAQNSLFNWKAAWKNEFVRNKVLTNLQRCPYIDTYLERQKKKHKRGQCFDQQLGLRHRCPWRTPVQISTDIRIILAQTGRVKLWAYYGAYDHYLLAKLFGTMQDFPPELPMYSMDIKQYTVALGDPALPDKSFNEHNALADARWNKEAFEFLGAYELDMHTSHKS